MQKSTAAVRAWQIPSASRTATAGAFTGKNSQGHRGLLVGLDVTTAGTGSVTAVVRALFPDGNWRTLFTGAAVVTAVTNFYSVYPGGPDTANSRASLGLPVDYQVEVIHNNANAITYSAFAELIP